MGARLPEEHPFEHVSSFVPATQQNVVDMMIGMPLEDSRSYAAALQSRGAGLQADYEARKRREAASDPAASQPVFAGVAGAEELRSVRYGLSRGPTRLQGLASYSAVIRKHCDALGSSHLARTPNSLVSPRRRGLVPFQRVSPDTSLNTFKSKSPMPGIKSPFADASNLSSTTGV
ncbi:hypothetical protein DIPPA_13523 [Diplonema papillatum]|nr:hypothetical protein DIPPA_13523 [Diplonema papillatum]